MGRSRVLPIKQPDEASCGPTSLKIALKILGKRVSLNRLTNLCNTSKAGTSTKDMVKAINQLGLKAVLLEKATLRHIKHTLSHKRYPCAQIVSYFYDMSGDNQPDINSGHWAVVASYSNTKKQIVLFDSYSGKRKSYDWMDFRKRWLDYGYKRKTIFGKQSMYSYKLVKKWQVRPLLLISKSTDTFPQFAMQTLNA